MIVGIDEAGRGPLAGAVVGCALYLKKEPPCLVRDSKLLSPAAREELFSWLCANAVYSLGLATPEEIDRVNILNATFLTFDRAIKSLLRKAPYLKDAQFIVDGNMFRTELAINYSCIPGADKKVKQVSCASVAAKVTRDYLMGLADFAYPQWNFAQHKGYPTREHFGLVAQHSLSPIHRRSFSSSAPRLGLKKSHESLSRKV